MLKAGTMACRLTYFDFRALGEPIRMLLTYGEIPYEEKRIDRFGKEWAENKPIYPMGQLPVLEIDNVKLHQSKAICRYVAKKSNLNGENDIEAASIDIAVDIIYDLIMKMRILRDIEDPTANERKLEEFKINVIPFFLGNLDEMAKSNKGYLACRKLTWADFYFAGAIEYLDRLCCTDILERYGNLRKVVNNVYNEPKLKDYMSKRPNTEF